MKISPQELRQIIKEEIVAIQEEEELEEGFMSRLMMGLGLMMAFAGPGQAGTDDLLVSSSPTTELNINNTKQLDSMVGQELQKSLSDTGQYVTGKNLIKFIKKSGANPGKLEAGNEFQSLVDQTNSNGVEIHYKQMKDGVLVALDAQSSDGNARTFNFKITDFGPEDAAGHQKNLKEIEDGVSPAVQFLKANMKAAQSGAQSSIK